jgi:hypothetical protein
MTEHFDTCSKKRRGKAQRSLDLIAAMRDAAEAAQPITGRGIGYKLFSAGLIPSMARNEMQRVYRLLKEAREQGDIPWEWIVDETRTIEQTPTWDNPEQYMRACARSYRLDFWNQQPHRVHAILREPDGAKFRLVHGTWGRGRWFGHAWLLLPHRQIYDPVLDQYWSERDYMKTFGATAERVYTFKEACKHVAATGHSGPWHEPDLSHPCRM